jgi:hypothetical protein
LHFFGCGEADAIIIKPDGTCMQMQLVQEL